MTNRDLAGRCGYLLATRPALRRSLIITGLLQVGFAWLLAAAPPAAASTLMVALNWTGLHDTQGVPLGAYYLSTVDTSEAVTSGSDVTLSPTSLIQWTSHAVATTISHQIVVAALACQAGLYLCLMALSLWLLRFAMSSVWLSWLATWFRPLFTTMNTMLTDLWVFPICLVLAVAVGGYQVLWHGRRGFGWGIVLSSFTIGLLGTALTRAPLTDLYADNGLLNQGRNLGFAVAQAAVNNGPLVEGGSPTAQLDTLTAQIVDGTVRAPFQLWNFGMVVDGIGACGPAWSAAIRAGRPDGPAHAMAACGAPQALSYSQHLDMGNAMLGIVYCLLGLVFTVFVVYVAYSYLLVAGKAFLNLFLAVPGAMAAMIYGRPRRRGWRRLILFFKHAVTVFAYVTYISVAALILEKTASPGGYADQAGMTHPVARLVMIAATSALAIGLFYYLKRELGDHSHDDVVSAVSAMGHRAHDGYQRGHQAWNSRQRNESHPQHDTDEPDQPLTGPPVPGRVQFKNGFHRPHQPAPEAAATQVPEATAATAATAQAPKFAAFTAEAAEAGAALTAPEVVLPAVAAAAVYQRHATPSNTHVPRGPAERTDPDCPVPGRASFARGRNGSTAQPQCTVSDTDAPRPDPVTPSSRA